MVDEVSDSNIKAIEAEIKKQEEAKMSQLEKDLRAKLATEQKLKELEQEKQRLAQEIENAKKEAESNQKKQEEEINKLRKEMETKTIDFQTSKAVVTNSNPFQPNTNDNLGSLKTQLKYNDELQRQVETESAKQFAKFYGYELK